MAASVAVVEAVRSDGEALYPPAEERGAPAALVDDVSLDLSVRLKGRDGRFLVLEMDSRVLMESSEMLRRMVMGSRKKEEVEVEDVEDLTAFQETIEMMYAKDLMGWLMRAGVSRAIDVLEVRLALCCFILLLFVTWIWLTIFLQMLYLLIKCELVCFGVLE